MTQYEGVIFAVRDVPVIGAKFTAGEPIMVVARAADVWIDKLDLDTGDKAIPEAIVAVKALSRQIGIQTAWNSDDKTYHSVYSSTPTAELESAASLLRNGTRSDRRNPDPLDVALGGRFTKLFPDLPCAAFDPTDLKLLARAMTAPPEESGPEAKEDPEENRSIPAAYTYLGQFVDHDLSFDRSSRLDESLDPAQLRALVDLRTPRFDLDNLYGRGPDDQPYMYEKDRVRMLLGEPMPGNPFDPGAVQLPRGPNGRALIGDPRDDENRIVAQLHAIFLRFHNKVVDQLGGKKNVSFEEVRQQVRWHYQWVLVDDFLRDDPRQQTYRSVFPDCLQASHDDTRTPGDGLGAHARGVLGGRLSLRALHDPPRVPAQHDDRGRPIFSGARGHTADLGGFRPIPADWAIDWQFFIDLGHDAEPAAGGRCSAG